MHHNSPNKPSQHKEKDITYRRQGKKKTMPAYADYVVDGGMHIPGYLLSVLGNRKVAELFQNGQLQSMLKGNKPSDPSEKQADELAEKALNESEIDAFMKETEALQDHILATGETPERNEHRFAGLLRNGQELDKKTKDYFEPRYGVDFAQVRIHKDAKANEMAEALNARAFTQNNDIVFNKGEYQPDTPDGKKLLAHELAHTLQPGEGIQRKDKEATQTVVENGWFVTEENNSLFIEYKAPVTDEDIKIEHLANKIVSGTASSDQIHQIFDALKAKGVVKGSLWNSYTFKDTPILDGLEPRGKVDVGFLYNLEFLKKPEGKKAPEQEGFDLFKIIADFFGVLFQVHSVDRAAVMEKIVGKNSSELDKILKEVIKYDDSVYKNVFTKELAKKYRPIVKLDNDGNKIYHYKDGKKTNSLKCQTFCNKLYDEAIRKLDAYLGLGGNLIKNTAPVIGEMLDYYNFFESNKNMVELDESLGFSRDRGEKINSMKKVQELANQGYLIVFYNDDPEYSDHIGFVVSDKNKLETFYAKDEKNAANSYYKNEYGQNAKGSSIRNNELPIVFQAGSFPGYSSFLFAANYFRDVDFNTWVTGGLHFYIIKKGK